MPKPKGLINVSKMGVDRQKG